MTRISSKIYPITGMSCATCALYVERMLKKARNGILVRDAESFDLMQKVKAVMIDKAGFLLNPMMAAAAMALSSASVVSNSLRLRGLRL